jgi:plasmid stabilization system protein ParE
MQKIQRIYLAAKSLTRFPFKGRAARSGHLRELILTPMPYLIVYEVSDSHIHLLRIFHAAQDRS